MIATVPALSKSRLPRCVAFTLLYFSQGVPPGITAVALPAYLAMQGVSPALWNVPLVIPAFLYAAAIFDTFFVVALLATAMALCWRRVSATQFCLYAACVNMGASAGATLYGLVSYALEYTELFLILAGIASGCAVLSLFVTIKPHVRYVAQLDAQTAGPRTATASFGLGASPRGKSR
jgi:hypothetical protein